MTEQKRFYVKKEYIIVFAATFGFALFAHGFAMFTKLSVLDDPLYQFEVGNTLTLGRWMLYLLYRLTRFAGYSGYSLPLFNGLVSFFFLALVSCILVNLFQIRHPLTLVAVSGILTVTPAVTGLLAYSYTMPYYLFGLLLCTGGTALATYGRKLPQMIVGIAMIACGTGIYQAYLPFVAGVLLIIILLQTADGKISGGKELLRMAGRFLLIAVAALLLYLAVNALLLSVSGEQLSDYRGVGTFGTTGMDGYIARVADAYTQFFAPASDASYHMFPMRLIWLFYLSVLFVVVLGVQTFRQLSQKEKVNGICFLLLLLLSPLVFNSIFVITGKEEVHALMVHAQSLWFFMAAALAEHCMDAGKPCTDDAGKIPGRGKLRTAFAVVTLLLCLGLTRYANACYLSTYYAQSEAQAYLNRLALKIEQQPGYYDKMEVAFISEYEKTAETLPSYDAFRAIVTFPYPRNAEELLNQYTWKLMMEQWCGFTPLTTDPARFAEMSEVQAMPCYPEEGSIAVIDGTVVVKFADSAASSD